jgi:hypothetical protein
VPPATEKKPAGGDPYFAAFLAFVADVLVLGLAALLGVAFLEAFLANCSRKVQERRAEA